MSTATPLSCEEQHVDCDVLVLGAGPAGIAAALRVLQRNLTSLVLEARSDRIGGRAHTSEPFGCNTPLDRGAKWIHGTCAQNPIVRLVRSREDMNHIFQGKGKSVKGMKNTRVQKKRNIMRVVLPRRDKAVNYSSESSEHGKTSVASDPTNCARDAADQVFRQIRNVAKEFKKRREKEEDLTIEDLLVRRYGDELIPVMKIVDGFTLNNKARTQFYRNLARQFIGTEEQDGRLALGRRDVESFLDEVVALLNTKICNFYENWEGAPIHKISARHGLDGTELPGGNVEVPGGYGSLIECLARPLMDRKVLRLGHKVVLVSTGESTQKDQCKSRVMVRCTLDDEMDEKVFVARMCIVTLPLGVLRQHIHPSLEPLFAPELPKPVLIAINSLGVAVMNKVALEFSTRWWPQDVSWLTIASSTGERNPTWHPFANFLVESGSKGSSNVLVCYLSGEFAMEAEVWTDEEIRDGCVDALRQADFTALEGFHPRVPDPTRVDVTRWYSDPCSMGSWTFLARGTSLKTLSSFRDCECVRRGLHFAGEHTCDGSSLGLDIGCVHGAWLSGEIAADRAVQALRDGNTTKDVKTPKSVLGGD